MDFYANTSSLSMNGSNSISEIQNDIETLKNTVVYKDGVQTITGDKNFTKKIVGTDNININGTGNNTINCGVAGYNDITVDGVVGLTMYADNIVFNNLDYQFQVGGNSKLNILPSTTELLNTANTLTASTGKNILNSTSGSNEIQLDGLAKITVATGLNTLDNTANTLTATSTNTISSNDKAYIKAGATIVPQGQPSNSVLIESNVIGLLAGKGQTASAIFNNTIQSNGTATDANTIECLAALGGNKILVTTGENLIKATTGTNKLTTANTSATANLIEATGTGASGNTIRTTAGTGSNTINSFGGSNILQVGGTPRITTATSLNTIENVTNTITATGSSSLSTNFISATGTGGGNTMLSSSGSNNIQGNTTSGTANIIQAINGGNNSITTVLSGTNTISNSGTGLNSITAVNGNNDIITSTGTNHIKSTSSSGTANEIKADGGGDNLITTTSGQTLITATSGSHKIETTSGTGSITINSFGGSNILQVGGVPKISTNSTDTTFDNLTRNVLSVNNVTKLVTTLTATTIYGNTNYISYASSKINIEFGADTTGTQSFIDFHSNTTNATDYDSRIISGSTASASNASATLTAETSSFRLSYLTGTTTRAISVNTLGGIVLTVSDERLKENITPIDSNETHLKLLQLKPKNYEWIDKEYMGGGTEIGLIAQDVIKIIPELVFTTNDDMYGIHYDKIPTLLLQSVKELQRQIDELKEMVRILSSK